MMGRVTRFLGALCAAIAATAVFTSPARAEPAMWVVRDADSTLYLFGTMHVLKPDLQWRTPAIDKALADAGEVWLEIDAEAAENPAAIQPYMDLLLDPVTPLSKRLPPDVYARYADMAARAGLPPPMVEPMRTWLAAVTLSLTVMNKAGYKEASGVDRAIAKDRGGRPLRTLETLGGQLGFLGSLPEAQQQALLVDTLDQLAKPGYVDDLVAAWAAGDVGTLDALYLADMRTRFPEAYAVFLTRRNAAWVETLAKELAGAGTDFVAVGALHLVGPDSVPAMLKARGFTVEQVTGKK